MTFAADPHAIRAFASTLPDSAQDTAAAKGYLADHAALSAMGEQGLLSRLFGIHTRIVDELNGRLDHLTTLLNEAKTSLNGAADLYQRTDQQAAARTDAAYPYVSRDDDTR